MGHIERRHSITLTACVERVFPLFTPLGETLWVEGWNPQFIHPENGETKQGMVFRTGSDEEETLWSCIEWNPAAHHVRYVRVTPRSRFGFVDVKCRDAGSAQTEAFIAYTFTALTDAGRSYLGDLSESAFRQMIEDWKVKINNWLQRGEIVAQVA